MSVENIYADGLLQAVLDGKEYLAHIEFQSSYDGRIGERLLEYNVLAVLKRDIEILLSSTELKSKVFSHEM